MKKIRKYKGYDSKYLLRYRESTPYQVTLRVRNYRLINGKAGGAEGYLAELAGEIRTHSLIIQQEIYLIGELLHSASELIKSDKSIKYNFKSWVEKNCDFSYSTALNFRRVYLVCLGDLEDVKHIPPSILYKVCSKNFPEKLRDYLLSSKKYRFMSLGSFEKLFQFYEEQGAECFEKNVEDYFRVSENKKNIDIAVYKTDEAISILKSKRESLNFARRKELNKNDDHVTFTDKLINHIDESFLASIGKLEKLKEFLNSLKDDRQSDKEYKEKYAFNRSKYNIMFSSDAKDYAFDESTNTIIFPMSYNGV